MRGNDSVAFNIQASLASARLFAVAKSIAEATTTTSIRISPRYYKSWHAENDNITDMLLAHMPADAKMSRTDAADVAAHCAMFGDL